MHVYLIVFLLTRLLISNYLIFYTSLITFRSARTMKCDPKEMGYEATVLTPAAVRTESLI